MNDFTYVCRLAWDLISININNFSRNKILVKRTKFHNFHSRINNWICSKIKKKLYIYNYIII